MPHHYFRSKTITFWWTLAYFDATLVSCNNLLRNGTTLPLVHVRLIFLLVWSCRAIYFRQDVSTLFHCSTGSCCEQWKIHGSINLAKCCRVGVLKYVIHDQVMTTYRWAGLQFALVAICVSSLYLNTHNTILSPSHVSALQYSAALVAPVDPTNTPSTWQHPRVHSLGASTPCPVVNCHAGLRKWNPAICSYSNSRVKDAAPTIFC